MIVKKTEAKAEVSTEVEAGVTNEQLMELVMSLKAQNDALNAALKKKSRSEGEPVKMKENGQVVLSIPSGKGSIPMALYPWHWEYALGEGGKAVAAFLKANKKSLLTKEAWEARKASK